MGLRDLINWRLGFGTAPIGNLFRAVSSQEAEATLHAAWQHGVRYFDTAPAYGSGLAELRLGNFLARQPRDDFVVSTKVGRLVLDSPSEPRGLFEHGLRRQLGTDYTAAGTERSIEQSLDRLGLTRLDVVWVHDVAQDLHGDDWLQQLETARTGAFTVLDRLRDEGTIRAWGLATNRVEPIELTIALDKPRPDGFLLAGRYSLLDHAGALQRLLPAAAERGLSMIVGGPYNSGLSAGGATFDYGTPSASVIDRLEGIRRIASEYDVSMKALSLQFCLAHPTAVAVLPGASRPGRIREDSLALTEKTPAELWARLREAGLIADSAPVP